MQRIANAVGSVLSTLNISRLYFQRTGFSELSGIVTEVVVTEPNAPYGFGLMVALDFTESNYSFLYLDGHTCPWRFKERCTSSRNPQAATAIKHIGINTMNTLWKYEIHQISSHSLPRDNMILQKKLMRYRDVQGVLAVGPESRIMYGHIMRVRETDSGVVVEERHGLDMKTPQVQLVQLASRWEFKAEVFTIAGRWGKSIRNKTIVIDPGNPDIIIPLSLVGHLTSAGRIVSGEGVEISFQISGGVVISIRKDQLMIPGKPVKFRVVVSPYTEDIILGRPLVRSLDELVLDQPNRRIGFVVGKRPQQFSGPISFSSRVPKPFYGRPRIGPNKEVGFTAAQERETRMVYVGIVTKSRRRACHTFVSVDHLGMDLFDVETKPSATERIEWSKGVLELNVVWENAFRTISFKHDESKEGSAGGLEINEYYTHAEVCSLEMEPDIPSPKLFNAEIVENDETMCRICLAPYEEGDHVQRLHECTHTYHEHCLKEYHDSARVQDCPTCRRKIRLRRVEQVPPSTDT